MDLKCIISTRIIHACAEQTLALRYVHDRVREGNMLYERGG